MIRGTVITYNDMPLIKRCIESLRYKVDEIIAVDGRFADFPGDSEYSTDGTLEYLQSIPDVHVVCVSGLDEVHKRNSYLVGSAGDWYVMLDADEEWIGPRPSPAPELDAYVMKLKREKPYHEIDRVRLFKHIPGLHYEKKHYWLHDAHGNTFALVGKVGKNYRWAILKGSHIQHHELERPPARVRDKKVYYDILRKRERKFREYL